MVVVVTEVRSKLNLRRRRPPGTRRISGVQISSLVFSILLFSILYLRGILTGGFQGP